MQPSPDPLRWNVIRAFPWHALLLALYAPLQLGAHNLGQIPPEHIYRSVLLSGLAGLAALFLARVFVRNWASAGLAVTIVAVLFLSYGHVYHYIENLELGGILIGRHRYLLLVWAGLALVGLLWVIRRPAQARSLLPILNTISAVLLIFPVTQLVFYGARASQTGSTGDTVASARNSERSSGATASAELPDIYYIVLDAYGRSDDLRELFEYDNSAFLNELRDMGFFVAACAQSNYAKTDLSLSSSLNMEYVTTLDPSLVPGETDRLPLWNLIKDNAVKAALDEMGYTTIAFETGFDFSRFNNLDIFYTPPRRGLNEFEILYLRTTMAVLLDDSGLLERYYSTPEQRKRELILFDLETLAKLPSIPGPKFVFAHLIIPHQPFVFGPEGEHFIIPERVHKGQTYYSQADYVLGYRNQATFISSRISRAVQEIISTSTVPPVIIIQGDHGPSHFGESERMGILNAYYLPGGHSALYDTITPVNSFRLLFNTYFATDHALLDDVSYYSEYPRAYDFETIPNECRKVKALSER